MTIKPIWSSTNIYRNRSLRVLILVVALAQMSIGQSSRFFLSEPSSDFSISISPSSVIIPPGGTAKYTITVTGPTITSGLAFSISGLPAQATPTIVMESATVYSLTITTTRLIRQGEYVFTVTATNGGMSASANAKLIVLLGSS